jgi:uncharacterized protein (TIGR02186 family)
MTGTCRYLIAFTALLLLAATPSRAAPAPQEGLEIGISTDEIAVQSNFAGADITIFGAITRADPLLLALGKYDVVVTLEGPESATTVRRKERVFGIWINRHSVEFQPIPTSYSISSTRPIREIADEAVLQRYSIGAANLPLSPASATSPDVDVNEFRQALRRLKRENGLYQRDYRGVDFVSSSLFKASVRLPANIPVGQHVVHAYLFKNDEFVTEKELTLHVAKTGIEQYINYVAHEQPLLYGLFAVFLASIAGWLGSVVFRRD